MTKGKADLHILAERVRSVLPPDYATEKRMFGGITFLVNGNMLCCVSKQGLMARVGKDAEPEALTRPFARPCLGTGRPMAGFIMVEHQGLVDDTSLANWVSLARAYVESLPPKATREKPGKTRPRKTSSLGGHQ